jgi:hypothetical protein
VAVRFEVVHLLGKPMRTDGKRVICVRDAVVIQDPSGKGRV